MSDPIILFLVLFFIGLGGIIGVAIIYVIRELRKDGIKITEGPLVRFFGYVIGFILIILAILGMFICYG